MSEKDMDKIPVQKLEDIVKELKDEVDTIGNEYWTGYENGYCDALLDLLSEINES